MNVNRVALLETAGKVLAGETPTEWRSNVRFLLSLYKDGDQPLQQVIHSVFRSDWSEVSRALGLLAHMVRFPHLVYGLHIPKEAAELIFELNRDAFEVEERLPSFLFECAANQLRSLESLE
jgi:hypothetical protein